MIHKVEILTTPSCGNCMVVKKMLDEMNISYDVIDVTEKPEYLEKYPIFTAPGIVIDDKLEFTGIPKNMNLKKNFLKLVRQEQTFTDITLVFFSCFVYD